MQISVDEVHHDKADEAVALFRTSFAVAEGQEEGESIAHLVSRLFNTNESANLCGYCLTRSGLMIGCVLFTTLTMKPARRAMLLSPLAIATAYQQQGLGQRLVNHGVQQLRSRGIELLLTYGDPAFYSRTGFRTIDSEKIRPPCSLTYPDGWLGLSLTAVDIADVVAETDCVSAFRHPQYW